MKIGLISDTHGRVHPRIHEIFAGVDLILHAGDSGGDDVLDELEIIAPVFAVAGNVDSVSTRQPLKRIVDLPIGRIAIAHGHEYPVKPDQRAAELCGTFRPNRVRLILYGHSHIQRMEQREGIHIVNPGAASPPRFNHAESSVGILACDGPNADLRFEFVKLEWRKSGCG
ncbi:metallophosphoesterase family protein [Candidatus Sumerlaeota bacterium]|nr:metallophosphoesterase family protein [Candidatus Sumerlaeota bacterium]